MHIEYFPHGDHSHFGRNKQKIIANLIFLHWDELFVCDEYEFGFNDYCHY